MKEFMTILFVLSFAYFGFEMGHFLAKKGMIEKLIKYSCEKLIDRHSYEQCSLAIKDKFKWR